MSRGSRLRLRRGRWIRQEQDAKAGPKYLNSPETALYTKGQVLFNLDKAKACDHASWILRCWWKGRWIASRVFMGGIANVIATSGTAFTEHQVRLLARFTKRVVLNFDPDQAGANAAEKTIALLVEEDFEVRVVTLEGGLDPDRYMQGARDCRRTRTAVRGAVRYADYLIERAQVLFPARTPEAKVKALNFLLPHIRRIPNAIARNDFAENAAQKLGIESSLMRQELKQAAAAAAGERAGGAAAGGDGGGEDFAVCAGVAGCGFGAGAGGGAVGGES